MSWKVVGKNGKVVPKPLTAGAVVKVGSGSSSSSSACVSTAVFDAKIIADKDKTSSKAEAPQKKKAGLTVEDKRAALLGQF